MRKWIAGLAVFVGCEPVLLGGAVPVQAVQVSGGLDARVAVREEQKRDVMLEGLFLNLRQVFRDDLGDRWIVVAQADADDNLEEIRPYQLYGQYKGPLGRWNIRAGHYLLPFGLLADYDTERLVLDAIEEENIGIKLDTGLEVFGYAGAWDWAGSVSSGLGRRWPGEAQGHHAAVGRFARNGEGWKAGLSFLVGTIEPSEDFPAGSGDLSQRKAAVDFTQERGRWTVRSEISGGWEDDESVAGGLVLASFALRRWCDVDGKYAVLARRATDHLVGLGTTFRLGRGWVVRPAATVEFTQGKTTYAGILQLYYDFSTTY